MARPKTLGNASIHLQLTDELAEWLKIVAAETGLSQSEYIRQVLDEKRIGTQEEPQSELDELYQFLRVSGLDEELTQTLKAFLKYKRKNK